MDVSQPKRACPEREAQCEKHGVFTSHNFFSNMWSTCPTCVEEDGAAEEAARKNQARKERQATFLARSGLEGRFAESSFDSYAASSAEQRAVVDACLEFAQTTTPDSGQGLWLIGPPGTGKTHLGSAIVRYIIEKRDTEANIFSGREIIRMLRATWKNHGDGGLDWNGRATTEEGLIEQFGHVPLLVIDEIGVSFGTDAEHVQLFDIIDVRYKHKRPTVLLSNLPAKGIKEAIGDRAYDRLREGAKVLACQWESHRGAPPAGAKQ